MRTIYFIALGMFLYCTSAQSQSYSTGRVNFTYDNSGNLTERSVVYYESSQKSTSVTTEISEEILQGEDFRVYPNPATNSMYITLTEEALKEDHCMIFMYDNLGKLLLQEPASEAIHRVDVSGLISGNYILKLVYGNTHREWLVIVN